MLQALSLRIFLDAYRLFGCCLTPFASVQVACKRNDFFDAVPAAAGCVRCSLQECTFVVGGGGDDVAGGFYAISSDEERRAVGIVQNDNDVVGAGGTAAGEGTRKKV
ncbi:uncharacterized protein MONOS_17894 [Monocercomonoides exilis]|uniref:uncharacterized protein n=1 Tax=Monocercomonoides exilis TaxID=2049356 RepID=UPI003559FB36|nr:hypothetical protein MONOS_17894 [Monocercomonoides exilis]